MDGGTEVGQGELRTCDVGLEASALPQAGDAPIYSTISINSRTRARLNGSAGSSGTAG